MSRYRHFERVRIVDSPVTRERGIAGREGFVLGISVDDEASDIVHGYLVVFDPYDQAQRVVEDEIVSLGGFVPASSFYSGARARVSADGELMGYEPTPEAEPECAPEAEPE